MISDVGISIDKYTSNILITDGEYTGTIIRIKNLQWIDDDLKYDVEFKEFWRNNGEVKHAYESELQDFLDNEAFIIVKKLMALRMLIR